MENLTTETPGQTIQPPPQKDVHVDERTLKRIAAESLRQVDGVLGFGPSMADILKSGVDGEIAGIDIVADARNMVCIHAKVITEFGKNIPQIVSYATMHMANTMANVAGITLDKLDIEVTDTMTAEEYKLMAAKHHGLA